ncbi:redoxin domain-containing protein [Pseudoteredinibacter isoporae]|uniref:Methylamine dehydrogenase accessory protein MauD n=1 Tax=Pseudoteredinibacter isoporae TaxID=570281 RepID=A0A7X0JT75_9GAMM|nr:redoxin domain-containing protein [Pseudoteredinibacter isoporae]MBB6520946.1 methylamine dehydrogenase accessory protein MauD [Pseudoteredinibacter isoporae]NHO86511.1 redoxin domain-containing protein [Pseudoteredinibacter isoporae]NIB25037.1 redoxin domain-containing protein [Pseudoteredinibacter isoporae]
MTELLLISNAILWLCVIALLLVVVALARQIGVLYERVAPAGALMMNQTLKVGDKAPALEVEELASGRAITVGAQQKKAQLLFFLSPSCPVCKTLLPVLKSSAQAESSWLSVILASDGDAQEHVDFITEYRLEKFDYVLSERLGKLYGVAKLPYAVLIDDSGDVSSMGLINSREHLESLFESKELGIDSIQSYLQQGSDDDLAKEIRV